jgi:hypothetical protein
MSRLRDVVQTLMALRLVKTLIGGPVAIFDDNPQAQ